MAPACRLSIFPSHIGLAHRICGDASGVDATAIENGFASHLTCRGVATPYGGDFTGAMAAI